MDINLTNDQKQALKDYNKFLKNPNEKYMILQGSSGTGKTTLMVEFLKSYRKQHELINKIIQEKDSRPNVCVVLATTNPAVAVLRDTLADSDSNVVLKTVYSFLGLRPVPDYKTGDMHLLRKTNYKDAIYNHNAIDFPSQQTETKVSWDNVNNRLIYSNLLVFIDESSMVNVRLFKEIYTSFDDTCKIVFIGDEYQLLTQNQKNSFIAKLPYKKSVLSEVVRNKGAITKHSTAYRNILANGADFPKIDMPDIDCRYVNYDTFQEKIDEAFLNFKDDCRILAWTNTRVQEYNNYIRELLGKDKYFKPGEIAITNKPIMAKNYRRVIDSKVRITNIEKTEMRGIKGSVVTIDNSVTNFLPLNYDDYSKILRGYKKQNDWTTFYAIKDSWFDLRPAYASTIHKAQGATLETVFIDLDDIGRCHIPNTVARLLYVAISRASKQVYLCGKLPTKFGGG
jgi:exodeoxyribonuclease V